MECKWNQCTNEARLKSPFCSGTCKKRYARSETDVPVEVGQEPSGTQVGQADTDIAKAGSVVVAKVMPGKSTHPPCTPDQLTSSCLTCKDKPTCSYLHNMNSAVPGDAKYAGVI